MSGKKLELKQLGADGLVNLSIPCACPIDKLHVCGEGFPQCVPAKCVRKDSRGDDIYMPLSVEVTG